jgi:type VI secretion system secreted protein VgrG
MKRFKHLPRATRSRSAIQPKNWLFLVALLVALAVAGSAGAAATAVTLGTADSFAVLAGAGITNTGPTTVNGDVGTYPTPTESGAASLTITGTDHAGDAVTQQAKTDLVTAYNTAAGEGPTNPIAADLTA